MNTLFYSTENGAVDPVFYAVVPDSFMNRMSGNPFGHRPAPEAFPDAFHGGEADAPVLAPSDPWSF